MSVQYLQLFQNSGRLEVRDGAYRPSGNTVTMADYNRFTDRAKEYGITALREEPFDCNLFTLLRQRLEDHPLTTVENADLRLDIAPDLGGRIVRVTLKRNGEIIVGRTDRDSYFYPASGGYEESTTRTWSSTGFANPYTVERKGNTLVLTGKGVNGLIFRRDITLPEKGSHIKIDSSITNSSDKPVIARLLCRMELDADPDSAMVQAGSSEEKAADFYRDGVKKPAGVWSVRSAPGRWQVENRFKANAVEACRLVCDQRARTVCMEIDGYERELAPGKSTGLEQTWDVK